MLHSILRYDTYYILIYYHIYYNYIEKHIPCKNINDIAKADYIYAYTACKCSSKLIYAS